jgi:hypothetical protein
MVLQREGSFLDKAALKLPPTFTSKGLFHDIENDLVAAGVSAGRGSGGLY